MLTIAKEYGQSPQDVEQWDLYWLNRAVELNQGEAIHQIKQMKDAKKRK